MKKCLGCPICPFVSTGKWVKSSATNTRIEINQAVNCQTKNVIYCLSCKKCKKQYVGETDRKLQDRFSEHIGYVKNQKLEKATGYHFNLPGHKMADMEITVLEKVFNPEQKYRKVKETKFIEDLNTKYKGMNRKT